MNPYACGGPASLGPFRIGRNPSSTHGLWGQFAVQLVPLGDPRIAGAVDGDQLLAHPWAIKTGGPCTEDLFHVGNVLAAEEDHLKECQRLRVPDDDRLAAQRDLAAPLPCGLVERQRGEKHVHAQRAKKSLTVPMLLQAKKRAGCLELTTDFLQEPETLGRFLRRHKQGQVDVHVDDLLWRRQSGARRCSLTAILAGC